MEDTQIVENEGGAHLVIDGEQQSMPRYSNPQSHEMEQAYRRSATLWTTNHGSDHREKVQITRNFSLLPTHGTWR